MNKDCRNLFTRILNKYKIKVFLDADVFYNVDVQNIIDDINTELTANKYNL